MTTYQNYWNSIIEDLLDQLQASDVLHSNITDTLASSRRTQIFPNHIINELKIGLALKEGNMNTAFVAPMQAENRVPLMFCVIMFFRRLGSFN